METYFAQDGSYGDAADMVVIDTSDWNDDDWNEIEWASDYERVGVAQEIMERRTR